MAGEDSMHKGDAKPPIPGKPSVEVLDATSIRVSWTAVQCTPLVTFYGVSVNDGVNKYYNHKTGMAALVGQSAPPVPADVTSVVVKGLDADVICRAKVCAQNAVGWSNYGVYSAHKDDSMPPIPGEPTVEVLDATSIRISWTAVQCAPPVTFYGVSVNDGVDKYYNHNTGMAALVGQSAPPVPADVTSVVVKGLAADLCRAKVCAQNAVGWSNYGACNSHKDDAKPPIPGEPWVEVVDATSIRVSWTAVQCTPPLTFYGVSVNDGVVKYYNHKTGMAALAGQDALPVPADVTSVVVKGLAADILCRAKVCAKNAVGWSTYGEYSVHKDDAKPPIPGKPTVEAAPPIPASAAQRAPPDPAVAEVIAAANKEEEAAAEADKRSAKEAAEQALTNFTEEAAKGMGPKEMTLMIMLPDGKKKKLRVAAGSLVQLQSSICMSFDLPSPPASSFEIFDEGFQEFVDLDDFGELGETGKLRVSIVGNSSIRLSALTETDATRMFNESAGSRFQVRRIQHVASDKLVALMTNYMYVLEDRRKNPGGVFNHELHSDPAVRAAKDALCAKMKLHFKTKTLTAFDLQRANILPVWHGPVGGEAVANQIALTGFASLATLDAGYYGHGIYATLQALYACLYASEYPLPVQPDSNGDWVVLLCVAVVGMTYPVTNCSTDFVTWPPTPQEPSAWFGYPLKSGFDSHLVGVKGPEYLPAAADEEEFHELILKQDAQIIPVMKVYFRRK